VVGASCSSGNLRIRAKSNERTIISVHLLTQGLLKRPRVLIFDEATSGLDDVSAEHIGEAVNFLRSKTTVLLVAHKVPACLKFDQQVRLGAR
jgi:ATP-binding cassette, subfamily B, bacterial HlyB/CyaB